MIYFKSDSCGCYINHVGSTLRSDTKTIPTLYSGVKRGGRGFPQRGDDEVGEEGKHKKR